MSHSVMCLRSDARKLVLACLGVATMVLPGCRDIAGGSGGPPNLQITVESGANQVVKAGAPFPEPIRVRATVDGQPFTNHLTFAYSEATAPTSTMTYYPNANGQFGYTRTVGTTPGTFTVTVYHAHCSGPDLSGGCGGGVVNVGTTIVNGQIVP